MEPSSKTEVQSLDFNGGYFALLPVAAFLHALSYSWQKWGDLLVDCGRDLDVARQLSEGRVLYADMRYWFGPLAPYLNAGLFKIFGVNANVLMAAGVAAAALLTWILYRLAREFLSRLGAGLVAAAFVYLCAFGHLYVNGGFNFALPYSYAAVYGMLAAGASLYFLILHTQRKRPVYFGMSEVCLLLAALAKVEIFFAAAAAHLIFFMAMFRRERPKGPAENYSPKSARGGRRAASSGAAYLRETNFPAAPKIKIYAAGYLLGVILVVSVYGIFWGQIGADLINDNLLIRGHMGTSQAFFARHMGFEDLRASLAELLYSLLAVSGAVFLGWAGGVAAERLPWRREARVLLGALVALGASGIYCALPFSYAFRFLPFASLVVFFVLALRWWRHPAGQPLKHLLLWTFTLAILARIPLKAGAFHYGFFLLPIPLAACGVLWFSYLPRLVARTELARRVFICGAAGVFAMLCWVHYRASKAAYDLHTEALDSACGRMILLDGNGRFPGKACTEAVRKLAAYPPRTKVMVVPEGVGLTFFSGLINPYGVQTFLPQDFCGAYDDQATLKRLQASPPDLIVRVAVDLSEYGSCGFGVDYAQHTAAWIDANYVFEPDGLIRIGKKKILN